MILRLGRGVSGGGICFRPGVLPRRSCAHWHWRAWAGGNWRGSRSDLPGPGRASRSAGSPGVRPSSARAPGTRTASPVRRHLGWWGGEGGQFSALPKSAMLYRDPAARAGRPDLGRSNVGRLLLGYGSQVRAQAGTDCFDIHPDQRLKRCAGLFDSEAQVTDPVAFLERLRHKSQISGWARPRTPGQVERGLERLAWLGCGRQPGQGGRVRGPLAGHARVVAPPRDRGLGHGPPCFRRLHTPGRSRPAPATGRGPPGPAGGLVRSRPTTAVLQAAGCLVPEGPVLRRAFTVGAGPLSGPACWSKTSPFPNRSHAAGLLRPGGCHRGRSCWWTWTARCRTWR